jgi:hypothetical protein
MLRTPPDRHVEVANEKMQVAGKIYDFAIALYLRPPIGAWSHTGHFAKCATEMRYVIKANCVCHLRDGWFSGFATLQ